jgi:3-deoxy-manno-octulosonate cytidylyltransferase (CMP-KDO synthetase)
MKTIIIPARYNSSRLPGKPLQLISGKSLIERVWTIAKSVKGIDEVYIATDDARIELHALEFSAKVMMTGNCPNGTERVFKLASDLKLQDNDWIINLQGDAVLTPPWVVQALLDATVNSYRLEIVTPATRITKAEYFAMQAAKLKGEVGGTMVVCDKVYNALYFSKSMIPYLRDSTIDNPPLYRHIGLYAYRFATLKKYNSLPPTVLEQIEGLEQLRALENGIPIRVVMVDYRGRTHGSIDSISDVREVEKVIEQEGELVAFDKK